MNKLNIFINIQSVTEGPDKWNNFCSIKYLMFVSCIYYILLAEACTTSINSTTVLFIFNTKHLNYIKYTCTWYL